MQQTVVDVYISFSNHLCGQAQSRGWCCTRHNIKGPRQSAFLVQAIVLLLADSQSAGLALAQK